MKLAQYEAETICCLEKENFKLIGSLNIAEESLEIEKKKNKMLETKFGAEKEILECKLQEASAIIDKNEADNNFIETKQHLIKKDTAESTLNFQDMELSEATESDYDLIVKAELNTLTESRRNSQVFGVDNESTI